jgi:hypothetical protein
MIKKEIAEKLFKTKLSEQQKVELATMQKVESLYKELDKLMTAVERPASDVRNAAVQGEKLSNDGIQVAEQVLREIEDVKQAAKELGVKIDIDGYESGANSMLKAIRDYNEGYKVVKRFTAS